MIKKFKDMELQYKNPINIHRSMTFDSVRNKDQYCVGGVFCLSRGYTERFPNPVILANRLFQQLGLTYYRATTLANIIIQANEERRFPHAWSALREALRYGYR